MRNKHPLCLLLCWLLSASLAAAATYYVDVGTGDDRADGSSGTPWRTITHALNSSLSGDTINIAPGAYEAPAETFPLQVNGQRLIGTLGATPALSTRLLATDQVMALLGPASHVQGCLFRHKLGRAPACRTVIVAAGAANVRFTQNVAFADLGDLTAYPADSLTLLVSPGAQASVDSNYLLGNTAQVLSADNATLTFNDNALAHFDDGLLVQNIAGKSLSVIGNTFAGFRGRAVDLPSGVVKNNIFDSEPGGTLQPNSVALTNRGVQASVQTAYNNVYNVGRAYDNALPGLGALARDPRFIDPANYNYQLRSDSPCVGAGEGERDLGAFQFDHSASATPAVHVIYPSGGERVPRNQPVALTWYATRSVSAVSLSYSLDGGATYLPIASDTANDGLHLWTTPDTESAQGRVKVIAGVAAAFSDGNFTITASSGPSITTTSTTTTTTRSPLAPFALRGVSARGATSSSPAVLNLSLAAPSDSQALIVIFELGPPPKTVYEETFTVEAGDNQVVFNLVGRQGQGLPSGNYGFKVVFLKNGQTASGNFVLQRPIL